LNGLAAFTVKVAGMFSCLVYLVALQGLVYRHVYVAGPAIQYVLVAFFSSYQDQEQDQYQYQDVPGKSLSLLLPVCF